ncbi:hypothetical protein IKB17_05780 [bacterium]|nr:hypothetical protein [bacterium]
MSNPFKKALGWLVKNFGDDTSKIIITSSIVGWVISAIAQTVAIAFNPKFDKEQKSFLMPQELADAAVNIAAFFFVTQSTKKYVTKMFKTGKIAPKMVRNHLNSNKSLYENKVGKLDLNLDEAIKYDKLFPEKEYKTCKNLVTTLATIFGGVVSTNIITPVIRNNMASRMQKKYIEEISNANLMEKKTESENIKPLSNQTFKSHSLKI